MSRLVRCEAFSARQEMNGLFLEQFGMGSGANEDDHSRPATAVDLIGQQKVAADMTFPVTLPLALEGMIQPFRPERAIIDNEQQHGLFEPVHVIALGARQVLPILDETFGIVCGARLLSAGFFKIGEHRG
jgi:hypothetical protein